MTTSALISLILTNYEQVSATDADNTARRAKVLSFCQEAFDETWVYSDWVFTYITGTVTINAASDSGDLPADFMEFGKEGGYWDNDNKAQMDEIRPVSAYAGVVAGTPGDGVGMAATYGTNVTTGRFTLKLPGLATASKTIKVLYRKNPPTLVDSTDATANNLWQIPAAHHNTVLVPYVASKARKAHGDSQTYMDVYQRGLDRMLVTERPRKTKVQFLPRVLGSMRMW